MSTLTKWFIGGIVTGLSLLLLAGIWRASPFGMWGMGWGNGQMSSTYTHQPAMMSNHMAGHMAHPMGHHQTMMGQHQNMMFNQTNP